MESRITAIETDLRNFKENVQEHIARMSDGMRSMNDAIMKLVAGQAELRGDITNLRVDLKGDITNLRLELNGDINTLRTEVKGDFNTLRTEVKGDISTLRTEVKGHISTLRTEVKGDFNTLRAEMNGRLEALEKKIIRWFVATGLSCAGLAFSAARFIN